MGFEGFWGFEFRVWGFRVLGFGFGFWGFGFRVGLQLFDGYLL